MNSIVDNNLVYISWIWMAFFGTQNHWFIPYHTILESMFSCRYVCLYFILHTYFKLILSVCTKVEFVLNWKYLWTCHKSKLPQYIYSIIIIIIKGERGWCGLGERVVISLSQVIVVVEKLYWIHCYGPSSPDSTLSSGLLIQGLLSILGKG